MTEEQKELLIAKLIDTPSLLTDEDLDEILGDDELRDIYEVSALLSGTCMSDKNFIMSEEWKQFRSVMRRRSSLINKVVCVAAIFIGVILISGIAMQIIQNFSKLDTHLPQVAHVDKTILSDKRGDVNLDLDDNVGNINENSICDVNIESKLNKKHRHVEEILQGNDDIIIEDDIDVDEYLRIQQARIDNDLALQSAEIYKYEYQPILEILAIMGEEDENLISEIKQVTIQ